MRTRRLRPEHTWLLLVVLAGLLLRLIHANQWPLWSDEAMTLLIAQRPFWHLFLVPLDPTPGLYYALHKLLLGPDVGVVAARSISIAAGTMSIIAAYAFARAAGIPALLTAAFVALSFPLIDYSQEARAYALLVLLIILSAWAFVSRHWPAFALTSVLALYTHLVAIFWIIPAVAVVAAMDRRSWPALLLALIAAVPELSRLVHYPRENFSWLAQASVPEALRTLAMAILPALMLLPVVRRPSFTNPMTAWALAILLAAPVALWLAGFLVPMFMERTILLAIPGYLALLAAALRPGAQLPAVAVFAGLLLFTGTMRPREDWRAIRPAGLPVLCEPRQAAAFRHATGWSGPVVLRYTSGGKILRGSLRDYFVALSTGRFAGSADTRGAPCIGLLPLA